MTPSPQWSFPPFRLDPDNACLWRDAERLALRPKTLGVLLHLVRHAGQVVRKEALLDTVWPETSVGDGVLKNCLGELRHLLGDTAREPRFIATVHRHGYRFIAPVTLVEASAEQASPPALAPLPAAPPPAERRQLTVLCGDVVASTTLATPLDPEDVQAVLQAYHRTGTEVIARFEGWLAQYLGDGLLVYFGYPQAHEDDAQRAILAGLALLQALDAFNTRIAPSYQAQLQLRMGIHTGLVVVGGHNPGQPEPLAWGATPNVAARLQGLAAPNTVLVSEATYRLTQGFFTWEALGAAHLPGLPQPLPIYRVQQASGAQTRLDAVPHSGLTPLVGREAEVALLLERWRQTTEGWGQVVLLSGEAGIGKSRLVQVVQTQVANTPARHLVCRGTPHHTHSALHPLITALERRLGWALDAAPADKLHTLTTALSACGLPLPEVVPPLATLLGLPVPESYAPLTLNPQPQKRQMLETVLAWLLAEAGQQPVLCIVEDLHWVDPSTLEFLHLLVAAVPTAAIYCLCTFRPDFVAPWPVASHVTALTLSRLSQSHMLAMVARLTAGKTLPPAVLDQIHAKTDGVPLFVEELTRMLLESDLLQESEHAYSLTAPLPAMAIPATLQGALLARLDRLATGKALAQTAAAIGREFTLELLAEVASLTPTALEPALQQLVAAELLVRQGQPPQARYRFKHALVQEAAYTSLLRRRRHQLHARIAEVLEARQAAPSPTPPEVLAQHYSAADLPQRAVPYWLQAGERCMQRSASVEAIAHLTRGLEELAHLPETPERARQELRLHTALGPALMVTRGVTAPEVARTYARLQALADTVGEIPRELWLFYYMRGDIETAQALGARLMALAQSRQETALIFEAHMVLGFTLFRLGDVQPAQAHLTQALALYDPAQHHAQAFLYAADPGVMLHCYAARALWLLGLPTQARAQAQQAIALAQELGHPFSHAYALTWTAFLHHLSHEPDAVQALAAEIIALATAQGFPFLAEAGALLQGWTLTVHGQPEAGLAQMTQALAGPRAAGVDQGLPYWLALLAEAHAQGGQVATGLALLEEARQVAHQAGGRYWEAELHRLTGVLLLRQEPPAPTPAETWLTQALAIAHRQHLKAWELRAALSLARLWQQQGQGSAGRDLLRAVLRGCTAAEETAEHHEAQTLLAVQDVSNAAPAS